ncbi:hypothetical protein BKA61DRAFT_679588 [Leptodontidium sp. MPI-SDFR-AT-0119]|nr:hypothetical protein BKA61DRAFT_679588 [Leptodontidium sp. MPI-SDFR-AT-0119]
MTSWLRLPAEIRCMIFRIVAQDYRFSEDKNSRAGYASLCREWQGVFEPWNFRRLILDQDRIFGLVDYMSKKTTEHRREYVAHILLRVRLDEYDCSVCQTREDDDTILLWRERLRTFGTGLTLERRACFASDSEHTFRDFRLKPSYPIQSSRDIDKNYTSYCLHAETLESLEDPTHGWVGGHPADFAHIPEGAKERVTGKLTLKFDLPEFALQKRKLPSVKIITGLLIRRQFYRQISARSLGKPLSEACSTLEWLRYEKWDDINFPSRQYYFRTQGEFNPWENLKAIALTSSSLVPNGRYFMKDYFLQAAGRAAASMPKLEIMELWNGGKGLSCVFRYISNAEGHGISWESTFDTETPCDPEVLQYWTGLRRHAQYEKCNSTATVTKVKRGIQDINSHVCTISILKLKDLVLDGFSYYELFWEENSREIRNNFDTERQAIKDNGEMNTSV